MGGWLEGQRWVDEGVGGWIKKEEGLTGFDEEVEEEVSEEAVAVLVEVLVLAAVCHGRGRWAGGWVGGWVNPSYGKGR